MKSEKKIAEKKPRKKDIRDVTQEVRDRVRQVLALIKFVGDSGSYYRSEKYGLSAVSKKAALIEARDILLDVAIREATYVQIAKSLGWFGRFLIGKRMNKAATIIKAEMIRVQAQIDALDKK